MKVSIYITSYNQKNYLIEAIESVLSQTLMPSQIIIVDDCSTDGSQDVIADYADRYPGLIIPIYHKKNMGVARTRIDALNAVTGDYVTYVDGDDRLMKTKLEKEIAILKANPDAQIACSNYYYMTPDGKRIRIWADGEMPPQGDVFLQTFARDFPRQSLFRMELVDYQAWKSIGFHDPNLHIYEDYDMRIRLTNQLRMLYCSEPLFEIRIHGTGLSKQSIDKHFTALEYIYRKNLHLLDDVNEADRNYVQERVRKLLARYAVRASAEAFKKGQPQRSWQFLKTSYHYNPKLPWIPMFKALLPNKIYRKAVSAKHVLLRK